MSLYRKGMPTLLYTSNKQLENVFKCHFQLSCIIKSGICCCSVTQQCPTLCYPVDCSTPGLSLPSSSPGVCPSSCSLHHWCHPAVSSSEVLFSFCPQSFPESGTFPMSHLFASDDQNTGASGSALVLRVNIQGWSPLRLTGCSCSPRDSEESSPAPQFEGINSLVFSFLYGPGLTTVRKHWENHSLDYMNLCQQSNVCAFLYMVKVGHCFSAKKQSSDFMAAITIQWF